MVPPAQKKYPKFCLLGSFNPTGRKLVFLFHSYITTLGSSWDVCSCWAPHNPVNLGLKSGHHQPCFLFYMDFSQAFCFLSQQPPNPCSAHVTLRGRQCELIWDTDLPGAGRSPGVWTCWFHQKFKIFLSTLGIHCRAARCVGTQFGNHRHRKWLGTALECHLTSTSSVAVLPWLLPLLHLNLSCAADLAGTLGPSSPDSCLLSASAAGDLI